MGLADDMDTASVSLLLTSGIFGVSWLKDIANKAEQNGREIDRRLTRLEEAIKTYTELEARVGHLEGRK